MTEDVQPSPRPEQDCDPDMPRRGYRPHTFTRYKLTLLVRGPYLTASPYPGRVLLDAVPLTDDPDAPKRYLHPGSQIKGRLLDALAHGADDAPPDMASKEKIEREKRELSPWLIVADMAVEVKTGDDQWRPPDPKTDLDEIARIAVDRETGAVASGMYGRVLAFAAGLELRLVGHLWLREDRFPKAQLQEMLDWLATQDGVGAGVDHGWGWLSGEAELKSCPPLQLPELKDGDPTPQRVLHLAINFATPVYVGQRWRRGNALEGLDHLPGSVLKRALADALAGEGAQVNGVPWFSGLHVSHFFPAISQDQRPHRLPLACCGWEDETEKKLDDLFRPGAESVPGEDRVPWPEKKKWSDFEDAYLNGPKLKPFSPDRVWRLHNAHDVLSRATGANGLFIRSALAPGKILGTLTWDGGPSEDSLLTWLKAGAVLWVGADRSSGFGHVELIEEKGGVTAKVDRWSVQDIRFDPDDWYLDAEKTTVAFSLNTPALLLPPQQLEELGKERTREKLRQALEEALQQIAGGGAGLTLKDFYVQHEAVAPYGGEMRVKRDPPGKTDSSRLFHPLVLTQPGSSFLVGGNADALKALIKQLAQGLLNPLALEQATELGYPGESFFPYHRLNGYGECVPLSFFRALEKKEEATP